MITFSTTFKVLDVKERTAKKKTGEPFVIKEFVVEANDKKKTQLLVRPMEGVNIGIGYTYDSKVGIASTPYGDKIFTNFIVVEAVQKGEAAHMIKDKPQPSLGIPDEIPF